MRANVKNRLKLIALLMVLSPKSFSFLKSNLYSFMLIKHLSYYLPARFFQHQTELKLWPEWKHFAKLGNSRSREPFYLLSSSTIILSRMSRCGLLHRKHGCLNALVCTPMCLIIIRQLNYPNPNPRMWDSWWNGLFLPSHHDPTLWKAAYILQLQVYPFWARNYFCTGFTQSWLGKRRRITQRNKKKYIKELVGNKNPSELN